MHVPLGSAVRIAILDDNVLALDVTELAQGLAKKLRRGLSERMPANNFGNERTNTRNNKRMYEATRRFYPYPSLLRINKELSEEEGGHAELGHYILERLATTDETQHKAGAAAKKSLQLKIIGQNALYERFMKNSQS
jgi:hypothetical protein